MNLNFDSSSISYGKPVYTSLYYHQTSIIDHLLRLDEFRSSEYPNGKNGVVISPPAAGKTRIAMSLISSLLRRINTLNKLIILVAPTQALVMQHANTISNGLHGVEAEYMVGPRQLTIDELGARGWEAYQVLLQRLKNVQQTVIQKLMSEAGQTHIHEDVENSIHSSISTNSDDEMEHETERDAKKLKPTEMNEKQCAILAEVLEMEFSDEHGLYTFYELTRVFTMTPAKLYSLLCNGSFRYSDIAVLVLDEVHHCVGLNPYTKLMDAFHTSCEIRSRPRVLGLTATLPISAQKLEECTPFEFFNEVSTALQNLTKRFDFELLTFFDFTGNTEWKEYNTIFFEQISTNSGAHALAESFEYEVIHPFNEYKQSRSWISDAPESDYRMNALLKEIDEDALNSEVLSKLNTHWTNMCEQLLNVLKGSGSWALQLAVNIYFGNNTKRSFYTAKKIYKYCFTSVDAFNKPEAVSAVNKFSFYKKHRNATECLRRLFQCQSKKFQSLYNEWNENRLHGHYEIEGHDLNTLHQNGIIDYRMKSIEEVFNDPMEIASRHKGGDKQTKFPKCPLCKSNLSYEKKERASHLKKECLIKTLIFTQSRFTAYMLNLYLTKRSLCRSKMMVGAASSGVTPLLNLKSSHKFDVLSHFESTKIDDPDTLDCIVCTSVLSEGIDVAACNLVFRYDPAQTATDNVQSRGRARATDAFYVHFISNYAQQRSIRLWDTYDSLSKFYRSADHKPSPPTYHPIESWSPPPLYIESTGAMITFDNAAVFLDNLYTKLDVQKGVYVQYAIKPLKNYTFNEITGEMKLQLPPLIIGDCTYIENASTYHCIVPTKFKKKQERLCYMALHILKTLTNTSPPVLAGHLELTPVKIAGDETGEKSPTISYKCSASQYFPTLFDGFITTRHYAIHTVELIHTVYEHEYDENDKAVEVKSQLPIALLLEEEIPPHWSDALKCTVYSKGVERRTYKYSHFKLIYKRMIELTKKEISLIETCHTLLTRILNIDSLLSLTETAADEQRHLLPFVCTEDGEPDFVYMQNLQTLATAQLNENGTHPFRMSVVSSPESCNSEDELTVLMRSHIESRRSEGLCVTVLESQLRHHPSHRVYEVLSEGVDLLQLLPVHRKYCWSPHPGYIKRRVTATIGNSIDIAAAASLVSPASLKIVTSYFSLHFLSWRLEGLMKLFVLYSKILEEMKCIHKNNIYYMSGMSPTILNEESIHLQFLVLQEAFMHASARMTPQHLQHPHQTLSNTSSLILSFQRLEHLGDGVLKLVIRLRFLVTKLFANSGSLTEFSSSYECNEKLTKRSKELHFYEYAVTDGFGHSRRLSSYRIKYIADKTMADAVEAILAAVYISNMSDVIYCETAEEYEEHAAASPTNEAPTPFPLSPTTFPPNWSFPVCAESKALHAAMLATQYLIGIDVIKPIYSEIHNMLNSMKDDVEEAYIEDKFKGPNQKAAQLWGIKFCNHELLTHASSLPQNTRCNWDRLEFIGDAVLNLMTTHWLYVSFPTATEDIIHKVKASLVNNNILAAFVLQRVQHCGFHMRDVINFGGAVVDESDFKVIGEYKFRLVDVGKLVFERDENEEVPELKNYLACFYEAVLGAYFIDTFFKDKCFSLKSVWDPFKRDFEMYYDTIRKIVIDQLPQACTNAF